MTEQPAAGATLGGEDLANIDADIEAAVAQGRSLHETRMAIMSRLRLLQVPDEMLAQIFEHIGRQYAAMGGTIGTEAAAAEGGGGGGSLLATVAGGGIGGLLGSLVGQPHLGAIAGAVGLNWLSGLGNSPEEAILLLREKAARGEISDPELQKALLQIDRLPG